MPVTTKYFYRDMLERVAATFVETFLAILVVGDMATVETAWIAAAAAALTVIKASVASRFGDKSASAID
jgi:hypothetical protein